MSDITVVPHPSFHLLSMRFHYKTVLLVLVLILLSTEFTSAEEAAKDGKEGIGVTLTTDKLIYKPGEVIQVTLEVFNTTNRDATFYFRSAQRYDFSIENKAGEVLWRWSDGRMFATVLGTEVLGIEKNEIVYTETFKGRLEPGYYKIRGRFIAKDQPMSGNLIIQLKK